MRDFAGGRTGGDRFLVLGLGAGPGVDLEVPADRADLIAYGVEGYGLDQLMDDYRHYSFAQLAVAIAATVIVKRTERGDRLFMHMITGAAHQALDNRALDLLPD